MDNLELGVIGNCAIAALIDPDATIRWCCFPRLDGDPVFCALLNGSADDAVDRETETGLFGLELRNQVRAEQAYLPNTAILQTTLYDDAGGVVEIIDFAPRFEQYERVYRPPMFIRRIRPVQGRPRLRVRMRPRFNYGEFAPETTQGSNHIRYMSSSQTLRLTTDIPISYILEEQHFGLERPVSMLLGSDESIQSDIEGTTRDLFERTLAHWHDWIRSLSIPFEWQDAVIRAAITLKLCNYEETGAIVAALTTSIPEASGTRRNWDYRYCWLRDAYFVIHALNRLGVTKTMEGYLSFIANIADDTKDGRLHPLYGILRSTDLGEREASHLSGYRGQGPVRIGNAAHNQTQHDVYGSVILASTHAFFDQRLAWKNTLEGFERLESLGRKAVIVFDHADAGPWELRTKAEVHTFSSVMCWAACDRLARIARQLQLPDRMRRWQRRADRLHAVICERSWNAGLNSFVSTFDGDQLDATLLLLHELDFLPGDDPRFVGTVDRIGTHLKRGDFLFRYTTADDFGTPDTAFVICGFWYIDALVAVGRPEEARALFETMLARRNGLGLLSEDLDPENGQLWGNFPQTYSMVGLINSAMHLSRKWEAAF
ncbi:glycoside hydrolase family 15 protein [Telmatospirillum sp.]|uniref:glycoside hydrolase family 15 protein n=1 Tax=Telmatospirillum sp. TaxID=2079197 RepID=UPI00284A587B|nr:glycoside hydrolase family 15 protein [Telmatospirillum sp.]MDR3435361.1 glycoside hydrolase family 15 protein [Telmatospirillum sp.]